MGCCSHVSTAGASAAQSASLHVNYTKGMVLGVDDFTQEFAYLAGRDQWIVRELFGAGVLRGLAVTAEDTGDGPRLRVSAGSAATPGGKLVCVPGDQCGVLNTWLARKDNADAVTRLLGTGSPPVPPPVSPPAVLALYLTLCYADCLTAPVPIPGEPCRSDDSLMAPSRVADDFRIELRLAAPDTAGDSGLRAFTAWLRQIPIADTSPPSPDDEADWLTELRAAAPSWYPALAPPPVVSPPVTAAPIAVPRARWPDFLRLAFRFWTAEIAPKTEPGCSGTPGAEANCLLLARVDVPVLFAGGVPAGAWQVAGAASTIHVEQSGRAFLTPFRLLQEWLLDQSPGASSTPTGLPQALDIGAGPSFAGLTTTGAVQVAFTTAASALTLGAAHHCVVCTAAITLTLPKAAPAIRGRVYVLKAASGACQVDAATGDTIEASASFALAANASVTLICDGAATWHVIASAT
jgi:hypothetical protein